MDLARDHWIWRLVARGSTGKGFLPMAPARAAPKRRAPAEAHAFTRETETDNFEETAPLVFPATRPRGTGDLKNRESP
jgi:hypothetical protein